MYACVCIETGGVHRNGRGCIETGVDADEFLQMIEITFLEILRGVDERVVVIGEKKLSY